MESTSQLPVKKMSASLQEVGSRQVFLSGLDITTEKCDVMRMFKEYGATHALVIQKPLSNAACITFSSAAEVQRMSADISKGKTFTMHETSLQIFRAKAGQDLNLQTPNLESTARDVHRYVPASCITQIADYLSFADRCRAAQVSRVWRDGVYDSFRKIKHLSTEDHRWDNTPDSKISLEKFLWVVKRCKTKLHSLVLNENTLSLNLKPNAVCIVINICTLVTSLDLTCMEITPAVVSRIAEKLTHLRDLSIGKCQGQMDLELHTVFTKNPYLRNFKAYKTMLTGHSLTVLPATIEKLFISVFSDLTIYYLANCIENLTDVSHLEIEYARKLNDKSVLRAVIDNSTIHRKIRTLKFNVCLFACDGNAENAAESQTYWIVVIDGMDLIQDSIQLGLNLTRSLTSLNHLELMFCMWVTSATIAEIAANMKSLEHLDITGCWTIDEKYGLDPLADLIGLKTLIMSELRSSVSGRFLRRCRVLKTLQCRDNSGVLTEDICTLLKNNDVIEMIDVEGCINIRRQMVDTANHVLTQSASPKRTLTLMIGGTMAFAKQVDSQSENLTIHNVRRSEKRYVVVI